MSNLRHPHRSRWYLPAIAGTVVTIGALTFLALFPGNAPDESTFDTVLDTALGIVTGILCGSLAVIILFVETRRRAAIRRRDATALNDLEPLKDLGR